ncbi:hypothetical protein NHX12_020828 [Muraenolepis orangiensis]|uniref:Uncharacterized protein n=1 Tax=Muraenolepis orangiensis TaxID=630683 RepID=A0A9Q0EXS8_9TELE|nr:hypothetical protein NHX12_020828 [Muraenolepis orangiensis]
MDGLRLPPLIEEVMDPSGLLEEERLATAHQAESFTRQIQRLQSQLESVREELDALEEEKESELSEAQEELRVAQEEVLLLQQSAEEAAGERENDIASMQEDLCRMRAELQRLRAASQGHELEVTTLRAELQKLHAASQGHELEVTTLRAEIAMKSRGGGAGDGADGSMSQLKEDYHSLRADRTDDIYVALTKEETSDAQLREAEERAQEVQRECEGLKEELVELQTLYDSSQRQRAGLDQELLCCRAELEELVSHRLKGNKSESWHLAVAGAVAMTAVVALVLSGIMRAVA